MEPYNVFGPELSCIQNTHLRDFAIECLNVAPKYFWTIPSSFSGKYHPVEELSIGGKVLHTKKCFILCKTWAEMQGFEQLTIDILLVASLLHDMCVAGTEYTKEEELHTLPNHAFLVRPLIEKHGIHSKFFNDLGLKKVYEPIMRIIECHMGRWTPEDKIDLVKEYCKEYNENYKEAYKAIVGLITSDYFSSRSFVHVEILRNVKE